VIVISDCRHYTECPDRSQGEFAVPAGLLDHRHVLWDFRPGWKLPKS